MSKKTELLAKAAVLGIEGADKLTIPKLEAAIAVAEASLKQLNPKGPKKEGPEQKKVEPLILDLDDVNGYLNIIGIIMVDDVRVQALSSHFMNMIQAKNPQIQSRPPQQPAPQQK